jgi:serine/threonine protein kinase
MDRVMKMPDGSVEESPAVAKPIRWKYALFKESIDAAIDELENWQSTADPTWYLVLKMATSKVDQALLRDNSATIAFFPATEKIRAGLKTDTAQGESGIFLPAKELERMTINDLPLSEAKEAQRISARKGLQKFILTSMESPPGGNVNTMTKDVRDLARKLCVDDPRTFGLLSCKGVIKQVDSSRAESQPRVSFTMVFRTPRNLSESSSLRNKLISGGDGIMLSDKFELARDLAKSIGYVHTFGFVHKSVRPEAVMVFHDTDSGMPAAFLVGFDSFRREEGKTYRRGDEDWEKNLYRHPSRQGPAPEDEYVMQHDIYSLGVCLLEVGLWRSFVSYDADGKNPVPSPALEVPFDDSTAPVEYNAKEHLVRLARSQLPRCVGRKYAEVVETCLTCLDPNNTDFGDEREFLDQDGILVGVRYIEKVR